MRVCLGDITYVVSVVRKFLIVDAYNVYSLGIYITLKLYFCLHNLVIDCISKICIRQISILPTLMWGLLRNLLIHRASAIEQFYSIISRYKKNSIYFQVSIYKKNYYPVICFSTFFLHVCVKLKPIGMRILHLINFHDLQLLVLVVESRGNDFYSREWQTACYCKKALL